MCMFKRGVWMRGEVMCVFKGGVWVRGEVRPTQKILVFG